MTFSAFGSRYSDLGDGVTTAFSFPRMFWADTDLLVYLVDTTTLVATLQTLVTHYTVAGAGTGSGTITFLTAPPNTKRVVRFRKTDQSNNVDLGSVTQLPVQSMEDQFDRTMMAVDEDRTKLGRTLMTEMTDEDGSGRMSARGNRITNAADPVDNQDVVTKAYIGTAISDAVDDAEAAAAAAAASAATATTQAGISTTQAGISTTQAGISTAQAAAAAASAIAADVSADDADADRIAAAASASAAAASALAAANVISALGFNFDTATADADPGAGDLRLNHATPASATAAYIDNEDRNAVDVSALLDAADDSTNTVKAIVTLRAQSDAAIRHVYNFTGSVVDGTGYRKLTLAYVGGSGAFTNGMPVWLIIDRTGDKGLDGAPGAGSGDVVGPAASIDNELPLFSGTTGKIIKRSTGTGFPQLASGVVQSYYSVPAGSLVGTTATQTLTNKTITSVTLDGTPVAPTQAQADDSTKVATTAYVRAAIAAVLNGVSSAFDTLAEIATDLGLKMVKTANLSDVANAATAFSNIKQAASDTATGVVELATAAEVITGTDTARAITPDALHDALAHQTLTDAATITVDLATGFNFSGASAAALLLGGNRTLGDPSNPSDGRSGVLWFGATGATRTLTLHANWILLAGVEVGPYSITTAQEVGVSYLCRGTTVFVTGIMRRG